MDPRDGGTNVHGVLFSDGGKRLQECGGTVSMICTSDTTTESAINSECDMFEGLDTENDNI